MPGAIDQPLLVASTSTLERETPPKTTLEDYIALKRSRSWWWIFQHESALLEEKNLVDEIASNVTWRAQQMDRLTIGEKLEVLFKLEESMSCRPGAPAELMEVLADAIESEVFPSPGVSAVEDFLQFYIDLKKKTTGSDALTVESWAKFDLGFEAEFRKDDAKAVFADSKRADVQKLIQDEVKGAVFHGQFRSYPVMRWFGGGILNWSHKCNFSMLESNAFELAKSYCSQKPLLGWTVLGWLHGLLLAQGRIDLGTFPMAPRVEAPFRRLSTVILPHFLFGVKDLSAVLDSQIKRVEDIRNKILAAVVSASMFGAQLAGQYLEKYIQDMPPADAT